MSFNNMEIQNGQRVLVNPSSKMQIHQKALDTVLVTNSLDPKAKVACRICHDDETSGSLITPCKCSGSIARVHQSCLKTWIKVKFPPNETPRGSPKCEVCHNKFVMSKKMKLRISRCPEITAQDKMRHVIFCSSIFFMLLCLSIVFVAFAKMRDRNENPKKSTDDDEGDILLIVFGVAFFVAVFVAFISQRHARLSIIQVAQQFFRNSKEWTVTSIDKHFDVTTGEVV
ncbi:hypothetical protein CHS0354_009651 [Potamilus streckersoni]|uniref:RING-CH-type domain-containing protein n=1 Tax=Potamilus streckersoni TaxID=2493646 RepID=A0AAE0S3Y4_9BIVA|nr:hypothetical protein CHS0354_009651 [Potamilus streckersoni]